MEREKPLAVMTYYATHPQSYYGKGDVTCEFVGIARNDRESEHRRRIHFNGAGGDVAAGKYNDGSEAMRPVLTARWSRQWRRHGGNTKNHSAEKIFPGKMLKCGSR